MKNKERIQILENRLNIQSRLLDNIITTLELDNEQEGLKQLDQSVFNGLDEKWRFAAVDSNSEASVFDGEPELRPMLFGLSDELDGAKDFLVLSERYDTSNWKNSLIERESKPKLKQLDQSVFNGLDSKWEYAAVDGSTSRAYVFEHRPHLDHGEDYWGIYVGLQRFIGEDFDASNWKESLIKRETNELTGSELCKAMLARGDTRIMCIVSDEGTRRELTHVIRAYSDGSFHTKANSWKYAVPINNHGEPLTSSDVGL